MRAVTRRTGLSPDVLRAWEKRYHAIEPQRSGGGQRLYSDDDLERLSLLIRVTALGKNISQVAGLRTDELRTLLMRDESGLEASSGQDDARAAEEVRAAAIGLVQAFEGTEAEKVLRRGALVLGIGALIDRVIIPVIYEIEDRRQRGECSAAHARFAHGVTERVLAWVTETASQVPSAPQIALATTEEARDELGIHIVGAVAATIGWRVMSLGGGLPADAIVLATRQSGARVLALSFRSANGIRQAREQLAEIRESLPHGVAVITSGAGAVELQQDLAALGVTVLPGQGELRAFLESYS